jgi:hypothetical protein
VDVEVLLASPSRRRARRPFRRCRRRGEVTAGDRLLRLGHELLLLANRHFLVLGRVPPSSDLDGPGLVALGARQEEREDAVAVLGPDSFRIDLDRYTPRSNRPEDRSLRCKAAFSGKATDFAPDSLSVLPFTCTSMSDFLTPGISVMMMKSSPLRNTFIGG